MCYKDLSGAICLDIAEGFLELHRLTQRRRQNDGEEVFHEAVAAAFVGEAEGFLKDLFSDVDDPSRRLLVHIVSICGRWWLESEGKNDKKNVRRQIFCKPKCMFHLMSSR